MCVVAAQPQQTPPHTPHPTPPTPHSTHCLHWLTGSVRGCLLAGPVDHFIIGRGRVRGREGMERDDVTVSASRLCISQPGSPGSASTPSALLRFQVSARQSTYSEEQVPLCRQIRRSVDPQCGNRCSTQTHSRPPPAPLSSCSLH